MGKSKYNIAKRARGWAHKYFLYGLHTKQLLIKDVPVVRQTVAKAVERLMREAYQKGLEDGHDQSPSFRPSGIQMGYE